MICSLRRTVRLVLRVVGTLAVATLALARDSAAQSPENVAVVINEASDDSKAVGEHYIQARGIPADNVIRIKTSTDETIPFAAFAATIQQPIALALQRANLQDRVLYIVLTKGVPLRIAGTFGQDGTVASVDSELTLLYRRLVGRDVPVRGRVDNPYFLGSKPTAAAKPFSRRDQDIYLVSRLDAFTVAEAKALVDRAARTSREGRIVLDQRDTLVNRLGEDWLGLAAQALTRAGHGERVLLEATDKPARDVSPVLGYFSWGSTDPQNRVRTVKMDFAPGAIAGSFVSTDARTFKEPPAAWQPTNTSDRATWFGGSPQSLVGDLIREGVTGVAGQVSEPYLQSAVRPDILFPSYAGGFNLVEAFYLSIPHLSWQTIVVGDPLCTPFSRSSVLSRADIEGPFDDELGLPRFFAERRLRRAAEELPSATDAAVRLAVRGQTLLFRGDRDSARQAFEAASEQAPAAVPLHMLVADFLLSSGEAERASERYRRIIELQPNHAVALNNLAYDVAVRQEKPAEALPLARKALSIAPNSPTIADTLGWVEYLLGNHAEATRILASAAKASPGNADVRLHAAFAWAAQGARGAAASELEAALKLNPDLGSRADVEALKKKVAR
jgi:uncharacterized protein (TIGR03790 family)